MSKPRPPKKSETLEIRLSHQAKQALMRKALEEGRSASELVRLSIDRYLAEPKEARPMFATPLIPLGLAGAGGIVLFFSALAPAPLTASPDLRGAFEALDHDGDGAVSLSEFTAGSPDRLFMVERKPPASGDARPFVLPIRQALPAPPPGASSPPLALLKTEFGRQDTSGDGAVSFDEFRAFHEQVMHEGFAALDANSDGALDRSEMAAAAAAGPPGLPVPDFAGLDKDGDGRISEPEFWG